MIFLYVNREELFEKDHQSFENSINYNELFYTSTAVIDEGCQIGAGTKVWHFSHIMQNAILGENCNIGQNVVVSPEVILGKNVKVQNNVSIYTGVIWMMMFF